MTSEPPDFERSPAYLLLRLGDTARNMLDTELAAWDLDTRLLRTLIAARSGQLSQQDLCAVTTMDRTTMVGLVDRLADKGFVQRHPHPSDRRKHVVAMTPSGHSTLEQVMHKLSQSEQEFLAALDSLKIASLTEALRTLYQAHDPTHHRPDDSEPGEERPLFGGEGLALAGFYAPASIGDRHVTGYGSIVTRSAPTARWVLTVVATS